jgi:hypothetical protein
VVHHVSGDDGVGGAHFGVTGKDYEDITTQGRREGCGGLWIPTFAGMTEMRLIAGVRRSRCVYRVKKRWKKAISPWYWCEKGYFEAASFLIRRGSPSGG